MKNQAFIKTAGALAAVSLLFLPVAGCGPFSFTGIDLIFKDQGDAIFKVLLGLSILSGVIIIFLNKKSQSFVMSVLGIVLLFTLYGYAKWKMRATGSDNNGITLDAAANAVEVKSGSYLALLAFLVAAVLSRMNKELMSAAAAPAIADDTVSKKPDEGTV